MAAASVSVGDLIVDGVAVPRSESLVYLGSTLDARGEMDRRVALAAASFLRLRRLWRERRVSLRTKARGYVAVVRATLLYAVETWAPREADVRRLGVADRSWLRRILGVSRADRLSNVELHRRLGVPPWSPRSRVVDGGSLATC